jgi:hypothetical protein
MVLTGMAKQRAKAVGLGATGSLLRMPKTSEQCLKDSSVIAQALAETAYFRGAVATPEYLALYSRRLAIEYLPGVLASLAKLGETERAEGENALPTLGMILGNRPVRTTLEGD